jgi:hypothetical protein
MVESKNSLTVEGTDGVVKIHLPPGKAILLTSIALIGIVETYVASGALAMN